MIPRLRTSIGTFALTSALALVAAGCGSETPAVVPAPTGTGGQSPTIDGVENAESTTKRTISDPETKRAILDNVVKLVRDAATNAGGDNFNIATANLNDYFLDSRPEDFQVGDAAEKFLSAQGLPPGSMESIVRRDFLQADGRHIEDSLLYHSIATRVAGDGDDLTRVSRVFDWTVRHAMLVPNGTLTPPGFPQAQARPFDVLLRGMAVEQRGGWSERGWLFMVLCRQLGLDAGLLAYTPPGRAPGPVPKPQLLATPKRESRVWAVAVLIGGKPYLFEPAIGIPVPSPDGRSVATLEEALTDPSVLGRLDLPGRMYEPTHAELASSSIKVLLESSLGSLAPRMRMLQADLAGKNRMVLYRDPVEEAEAFRTALGARCSGVSLWQLPLVVEYSLFHNSDFVTATQYPLQFFVAKWPLLAARLAQLQGDSATAIRSYAGFRFSDRTLEADGKTVIPPQVQAILDMFSTYYLALAQLEQANTSQARFLFGETLRLLPEPGKGSPYYSMFRWGAATNLGLLYADEGNIPLAVRYLTEPMPTPQEHGNHVRARELIWKAPFAPEAPVPAVIPSEAKGKLQ